MSWQEYANRSLWPPSEALLRVEGLVQFTNPFLSPISTNAYSDHIKPVGHHLSIWRLLLLLLLSSLLRFLGTFRS